MDDALARPLRGSLFPGDGSSDYSIEFTCPTPAPVLAQERSCPLRLVDTRDVLGNIGFAVTPDGTQLAFASLHGLPREGPTPLSRGQGALTTFTHRPDVLAETWEDQPYPPPPDLYAETDTVRSLDVHAYFSPDGVLAVAALYAARPEGETLAPWRYTVVAWKFDALEHLDYDAGYQAFPLPDGVQAEGVLLHGLPDDHRVLLLWRERLDNATNPPGLVRLAAAVTTTDPSRPWTPLDATRNVGPCVEMTNPVVVGTRVLVGCLATQDPHAGRLVLYGFDPKTRRVTLQGRTPLSASSAVLAASDDGDLALLQVSVRNTTAIRAELTTSATGAHWSKPRDVGPLLHNASNEVETARVTAFHSQASTQTLHLVYEEEATAAERDAGQPQWRKAFVVLDDVGELLVHVDLGLADSGEVFEAPHGPDGSAYGDTRDTLLGVNGREYLAFTDYGVAVVAALIEHDERAPRSLAVAPVDPPAVAAGPESVPFPYGPAVLAAAVAVEGLRRLAAQRLPWGADRRRP